MTPEELSIALPATRLQPRSFVLKPGQVMFVSGLGRIDYAQVSPSVIVTINGDRELQKLTWNHSCWSQSKVVEVKL